MIKWCRPLFRAAIFCFVAAVIFLSMLAATTHAAERESSKEQVMDWRNSEGTSLLFNPGPRYRAARVLVFPPGTRQSMCGPGTTLEEAHLVGLPFNACHDGYRCSEGMIVSAAPNGACASYYIDTRAGWHSSDYRRNPGWDAQIISGGAGKPLIYRYLNRAFDSENPCVMHEIGTIYQGYAGAVGTNTHFRRDPAGAAFTFGRFRSVVGQFDIAVDLASLKPSRCRNTPAIYVTADFHIGYPSKTAPGAIEHRQLLGVLVFGMDGVALHGNKSRSPIFWSGPINSTRGLLVHGEYVRRNIGVDLLPNLDSSYRSVRIDYKPLFKEFFDPPPGYTLDDAIITGFDVYSSVRGGDLVFSVKNIDVVGYR